MKRLATVQIIFTLFTIVALASRII